MENISQEFLQNLPSNCSESSCSLQDAAAAVCETVLMADVLLSSEEGSVWSAIQKRSAELVLFSKTLYIANTEEANLHFKHSQHILF